MAARYVDLHVHSWHSDGTMSPADIVAEAQEHNVGILAISDHDKLEGGRELLQLCKNTNIRAIPAVEIDTYDTGINFHFHILGYNVDLDNAAFIAFAAQARQALDHGSDVLIGAMMRDYPQLSLEEFAVFEMPKGGGGWPMLHYLLARGVTTQLKEGMRFYPQYNVGYDINGFPDVETTCRAIHAAGGKAIIAHPGDYPEIPPEQFKDTLHHLIDCGIDGIEAFYPAYSSQVTADCLAVCNDRKLLVTCGSDCHGSFNKTHIGELPVTLDMLRLDGIL